MAREKRREMEELTRDLRTVFVGQLQVRVTEKDIKRFFKKVGSVKVKDIQLIKDKFTGRSKGFAYVELKSLEDVPKALMLNGQRFQFKKGKMGFPILVKASEAEKNYAHALDKQQQAEIAEGSKKLHISNLHLGVTENDLKTVLEPFGTVESLVLNRDPAGNSLGNGVVTFKTADVAGKALAKINGLDLAGKMMHVQLATALKQQQAAAAMVPAGGPPDINNASWKLDDGSGGANMNAQARSVLMARLAGGGNPRPNMLAQNRPMQPMGTGTNMMPLGTPSGARLAVMGGNPGMAGMGMMNPAMGNPAAMLQQSKGVPVGNPSPCMVVKNMFTPEEEQEEDWEDDIKEDTVEEVSKFGKVKHCFVDKNSQGFVYLMFDTMAGGAACGNALHGRFFNRKMISVQFFPTTAYTAKFGL